MQKEQLEDNEIASDEKYENSRLKYELIEDLAYYMKQAKENGQNKPIVFLGAGASKTGDIPLAKEIIENIKTNYKNPKIGRLDEKDMTYAKLMEYLTPFERNMLLKTYIDNGKINVTHLYLAHLMKEDYIDYVLTVNFDNLMLRALALYNIFPPTYDMAILKDPTTTPFEKGSVVYLHGQHHGLWLLNTQEEMAKVNTVIPPIFNKLSDKRLWIFIGYSGDDPIFEHITKLGRFDNGLYWVQYRDTCPSDKVCDGLLRKENTNAYVIKDYDADSFMISLANNLGLSQPVIIDKPFSALKEQLENIKDIDDDKHYKDVKERLEIAKEQVNDAIEQYEKGNILVTKEMKGDVNINILKKEIINLQFTTKYDSLFEEKVNEFLRNEEISKNYEMKKLLADIMFNWAYNISKAGKELEAIEKYSKAIELNPDYTEVYNNRGILYKNMEKEKKALSDYTKAIELNPNYATAYNNRGILYKNMKKEEEALSDYTKAIELNPNYATAYNNRGILYKNMEKEKEALSDYTKAIELNPNYATAYNNRGILYKNMEKEKEALSDYTKAIELNPNYAIAYNNRGILYKNMKKEEKALSDYTKAIKLNPEYAEVYSNRGILLSEMGRKEEALNDYNKALELNPNNTNAEKSKKVILEEIEKEIKHQNDSE